MIICTPPRKRARQEDENENDLHQGGGSSNITLVSSLLIDIKLEETAGIGRYTFAYADFPYVPPVTSLPLMKGDEGATKGKDWRLASEDERYYHGAVIWMRDLISRCHTRMGRKDLSWPAESLRLKMYHAIWMEMTERMLTMKFIPDKVRFYLRFSLEKHLKGRGGGGNAAGGISASFRRWLESLHEASKGKKEEWPFVIPKDDVEAFRRHHVERIVLHAASSVESPMPVDVVRMMIMDRYLH
jgi:hypothetical protein